MNIYLTYNDKSEESFDEVGFITFKDNKIILHFEDYKLPIRMSQIKRYRIKSELNINIEEEL